MEFSGIGKFINTPAKRYSSGMRVRLAFSVAAFLDPEILLIDEVLAVGDTEFQKKCIGKINDISNSGRTVLFVSHNLSAVQNLCTRGVVLDSGSIVFDGNVDGALQKYLNINSRNIKTPIAERLDREGSGEIKIQNISLTDLNENNIAQVLSGQDIKVKVKLINSDNQKFFISINIIDEMGVCISHISSRHSEIKSYGSQRTTAVCNIGSIPLPQVLILLL